MRLGAMELLVIFAVALLVIGPDKLPAFAKKLGQAMGQFKSYSDKVAKEIQESVTEPMEEAVEPIRKAMEPLEEVDKTIRENVREVEKTFSDIGKPGKKTADPAKEKAKTPESGEAEKATDGKDAVKKEEEEQQQ